MDIIQTPWIESFIYFAICKQSIKYVLFTENTKYLS